MKILIADSGSTKTHWAIVQNGKIIAKIKTQGIHPVYQSRKTIKEILHTELLGALPNGNTEQHILDEVYFYGTGCRNEWTGSMKDILSEIFPHTSKIETASDLLGAARSVCGHQPGIACILGTGSNSCIYDGKDIVENIPPLGYVLGDEGSGAVLGKLFFNALFKGDLSLEIKEDYLRWSGLTYTDIINKVYGQPLANRFLATASLYISEHLDSTALRNLVTANFRDFFQKNIRKYNYQNLPIGFVGSIAYVYASILKEVLAEEGCLLSQIVKSPIEGLVAFHVEKSLEKTKVHSMP
ncbi:MAG: ATPase [Prevotellaceae bacterium]|nr:ATPase [Prevotella sp.]MDD7257526.1 ATPase [Prevotellaceae bacterium]MDY6130131.1 ATPase [Prevotella sp.]